MSADLERKVREAAEQALDKKRSLLEWTDNAYLYGDGYRDGHLAAATLREKEIEYQKANARTAIDLLRLRSAEVGELKATVEELLARVAELEKIASLADSIAHEFEVAVESRNPVCGMSVPPSGDFISCARLPSAVGRMRWWAREIRKAQPITVPEAKDNAPQQGV